MLYYTILYYTILYYTILYYTILYYTILHYTILYCTIIHHCSHSLTIVIVLSKTSMHYITIHKVLRMNLWRDCRLTHAITKTVEWSATSRLFHPERKLSWLIVFCVSPDYRKQTVCKNLHHVALPNRRILVVHLRVKPLLRNALFALANQKSRSLNVLAIPARRAITDKYRPRTYSAAL